MLGVVYNPTFICAYICVKVCVGSLQGGSGNTEKTRNLTFRGKVVFVEA